jgi:C4-type Zn-finger protein
MTRNKTIEEKHEVQVHCPVCKGLVFTAYMTDSNIRALEGGRYVCVDCIKKMSPIVCI